MISSDFIKASQKYLMAPKGFYFEPMNQKHTDLILKWRNDRAISQHFLEQEKLTKEKQDIFLEKVAFQNRVDFVLVDEIKTQPIGVFSLKNLSTKPEIGQLLGESQYRGQGLGKKSTQALLYFGFKGLKLREIYARVWNENRINIELLKKLHFSVLDSKTVKNKTYLWMKINQEIFLNECD